MKYTLFLFSFFLLFGFSQSQEFLEMLAEEACECMKESGYEDKEFEEIQMTVGTCILKSVMSHNEEFEEYSEGRKLMDMDLERFGEQVGMHMGVICPDLFMHIDMNWADEEMTEIEFGKIISVEKRQFNVVNLESGDGSVLKFLWLWEFEGSRELQAGEFKDRWVNIIYSLVPLYDPSQNKYIDFRVIEAILSGE